jgi:hypothetical protein
MIVTKLHGGLGNQLFQWAATYAAAKKYECEYYFDLRYFSNKKIKKSSVDKWDYELDKFNIEIKEFSEPSPLPVRYDNFCYQPIEPNYYLYGYWQSEKYFVDYKDEILSILKNYEKEKYAKNPEKYRAVAAKYRAENLEKARESSRKSMRLRKPQRASWQMLRMARKLQATPKWLSEHELSWIKAHYVAAKENGANLAVDHIVPLRGREVCGLHVPWNLCLRTKSDNSKKHNKLTDEAYLPKQFGILVSESALPWNLRKESNYGNHMESR